MGRPKLADKLRRSAVFGVRFRASERAAIEADARAQRIGRVEYVRRAALQIAGFLPVGDLPRVSRTYDCMMVTWLGLALDDIANEAEAAGVPAAIVARLRELQDTAAKYAAGAPPR